MDKTITVELKAFLFRSFKPLHNEGIPPPPQLVNFVIVFPSALPKKKKTLALFKKKEKK